MNTVIGLISANYDTPGLGELSAERTVASMPFAGRYRLLDFPLSAMINAGITTVGLITPYKYRSIIDHVGAGKEWSLDRKHSGLFVLPGSVYGISAPDSRLLIKDLRSNAIFFQRSPAPYVLVSSSNLVANMDFREITEAHRSEENDITLVFGREGFLECFMINRDLILKVLEWYKTVEYMDMLKVLEPNFAEMKVGRFEFTGYAHTIYSVQDYFSRSMDLLKSEVREQLFRSDRPIMTKIQDSAPSRYLSGSKVSNALIPAGCIIGGTVENSVIFRGNFIEPGAVVRNSIIMQGCSIGEGAVLENVIVDKGNAIAPGVSLRGTPEDPFVVGKTKDEYAR